MKSKRVIIAKLALFLIGYIILEVLFQAGVALVLGLLGLPPKQPPGLLGVFILLARLFLIGSYLYLFNTCWGRPDGKEWLKRSSWRSAGPWISGLVLGIGAFLTTLLLRSWAKLVREVAFTNRLEAPGEIGFIFTGIAIGVLLEELVFRGTIYVTLRKINCSISVSTFLTSSLFSLFHIAGGKALLDLVFIFCFSILLCHMLERRKSIYLGFGFHLGWNLLATGGNIIRVQYFKDTVQHILWAKVISILVIGALIVIHKVWWKRSLARRGGVICPT